MNETLTQPELLIAALEAAINTNDRAAMLDLISPNDRSALPDWDDVPNYLWENWENLLDQATNILGI